MTRVVLLHGIHTQGPGPIAGMKPSLQARGFTVCDPDYGYILGLETRRINPVIVGCLMPFILPTDVLICHSNGCAIAYELMQHVPVHGAVFINAALKQNIVRPPGCEWIDVYYNAGDTATEAAKLGAELGLTDLFWGEMGHGGYVGTDPAITSIDCADMPRLPMVWGHSDIFMPINLPPWSVFIEDRIH